MFDSIYEFLAGIGYNHPLHPPALHVPTGLAIGAFLFALVALIFRRPALAQSARHCSILVLITLFPAALLGYMDWQYYFSGAPLDEITIKLIATGVLLVVLVLGLILGRKGRFGSKAVLITYAVNFLAVVVLGYFGAELAFGNKMPVAPPEYEAGARIYRANCNACHPYGGNIVNANLSVMGAPQLTDFNSFLVYSRNPKRPNGKIGIMPPVPGTKLSNQQMQELYEFITKVLERPRRTMDELQ